MKYTAVSCFLDMALIRLFVFGHWPDSSKGAFCSDTKRNAFRIPSKGPYRAFKEPFRRDTKEPFREPFKGIYKQSFISYFL